MTECAASFTRTHGIPANHVWVDRADGTALARLSTVAIALALTLSVAVIVALAVPFCIDIAATVRVTASDRITAFTATTKGLASNSAGRGGSASGSLTLLQLLQE